MTILRMPSNESVSTFKAKYILFKLEHHNPPDYPSGALRTQYLYGQHTLSGLLFSLQLKLSNRLIAVNNKVAVPNAESSNTRWDLGTRISRQPQPSKFFKMSGLNPGAPGHKWRVYRSTSPTLQ